jgi:probable DNA metabolism protein
MMIDMAKRHRDYSERVGRRVLKADKRLVDSMACDEARELYRLQQEVGRSLHAKKGFLRLKKAGDVLWADARIEHDILDLLLNHFRNRFPTFTIALGSKGRTLTAFPNGRVREYNLRVEDVVLRLSGVSVEGDGEVEGLWESFYQSQLIAERRNTALMDKMMPKKYRDTDAYEKRAVDGVMRLLDYFKSPI